MSPDVLDHCLELKVFSKDPPQEDELLDTENNVRVDIRTVRIKLKNSAGITSRCIRTDRIHDCRT